MDAALEQKLITSIDYWSHQVTKDNKVVVWDAEAGATVETQSLFYPTKEDLIPVVWTKLLTPKIALRLEEIWNQDGPYGIDKYISVVATNSLIDFKRRQDVRESEVLATSLDEPVTFSQSEDGVNEDVGTVEDLIPGTFEGQAVCVDNLWADLQEILTETEFDVLQSWAEGASVRETAQLQNLSKSAVHRYLARAREKAAQPVSDIEEIYNHSCLVRSGKTVSKRQIYFPRLTTHHYPAVQDRVVEYPQIEHPSFGWGWVLRTTDSGMLCDFPNRGRVEVNPNGTERVSKIKPRITYMPSPKTANIFEPETLRKISDIPMEHQCLASENAPQPAA
jgi:DNA-directed RNA polymerase specialized sigma24 family protein